MLRASAKHNGIEVNLHAVIDRSGDLGLANGAALLDFADACVGTDAGQVAAARQALSDKMGPDAVVKAAAVVGCFCMNDIAANAAGIPLDGPILESSADFRAAYGINDYPSARNSL